MTRITTLVENTASGPGLRGEHGLSFWIESADHRILFDTGQTDLLAHNARLLKIGLADTHAIALSHGHYDHSGGLSTALRAAPQARVYLHPEALQPKFSCHADGAIHEIGLPRLTEQDIRNRSGGLVFTPAPTKVAPGLFLTGPIPRNTLEDTGGRFYRDAACTEADPLTDDQALYFATAQGLVVVLGCAHAGLVNTLSYIRTLTGQTRIRAILGGMHLLNASEARLAFTIESLQDDGAQLLAPAHCTGVRPTMLLWQRYPSRCRACPVGTQFIFE